MPLIIPGPRALSDFRQAALLERCRMACPAISGVDGRYIFLVQPVEGADVDQARLRGVVGVAAAEETIGTGDEVGAIEVLVCPRPGTISPWSSKATDILRNCGLEDVARIERGTRYTIRGESLTRQDLVPVLPALHDRMTEAVVADVAVLFAEVEPRPLVYIPISTEGREALERANAEMGLALPDDEIDYLIESFQALGRDLTDVELVMFANVNSEHCRHKIFNAEWVIDGEPRPHSLFDMIRNTHATHPEWTLVAYSDNAGVIEGFRAPLFRSRQDDGHGYRYREESAHILCKVETHNHPTAISPYPGASTGVGGEIRDENATGTGGASQAGLCGFFVSHLRIPGFEQPWEKVIAEPPSRLASPLQIMAEGPIGGAAFGNEFGRPNILGVFRTCEDVVGGRHRGYHKPIMVAGGTGLIDAGQVLKKTPQKGDHVIQIGGPAMLIGLGGGYASSMDTGSNLEDLDFASVQRDNPEMQRRCHELICRCIELGDGNPIVSIHDCGAGGLSNACPELVEGVGATFDLRAVENDDPGMSPMELWSNEAQERYVLVVGRHDLARFTSMAARERCRFAVIGEVTGDEVLTLRDPLLGNSPVDELPLDVILGKPPRMVRDVAHLPQDLAAVDTAGIDLAEAVDRVLRFPAVAAKTFLITIADRTVTGLISRDQMVGPYQTPISDLAGTATSYTGYTGTAMAMGERTPVALIDAPASARLAIAEAVTNIAAARIGPVGKIKLSANWMCACAEEGEDALLHDAVRTVGMEFCPTLGVSIPVGKDSLSMRTVWEDSQGQSHTVVAPLSLVISAYAPVADIRATVTADLKPEPDSHLCLIDLGRGRHRLGGTALAQVYNQMGNASADADPDDVRRFFEAVQQMVAEGLLLAYHDRSDGGLLVTLCEMAFGGMSGLQVDVSDLGEDALAVLFAEEIGAVIQYRGADAERVLAIVEESGLSSCAHQLGRPTGGEQVEIRHCGEAVVSRPVREL
ncbi:phosphoribosylformylglycinamidine synthase, partial [Candidatus Latescibacterota bacterium]